MRMVFIIVAVFFLILTSAAGYLALRHPFIFQEWSTYPAMLRLKIQKPDPTIKTIDQFDSFIQRQLNAKSVQAASVALVSDGQIVWSKGYGFTNSQTGEVATADTPFMIGSISKAVMGTAIMHAVEHDELDLDTDINRYLQFSVSNPRIDDDEPITLRHLATHTSGIVDYDWVYGNSYQFGQTDVSMEQFLRSYLLPDGAVYNSKKNFLSAAAGEESEYSNIAAALAGHTLGEATGQRLDLYSAENIFTPLGMTNTGWFLSDFPDQSIIAQPYGLANRPVPHYSYPTWPEGQLRSSANDIARLLAMVMNKGELDGTRALTKKTVATMLQKNSFPGLNDEAGEGIFWSHTKSGVIGHNGGDLGVSSAMYFNPETRIGIVILTNASVSRGGEPVFNTARQITTGETAQEIINSINP